MNKKQMNDIYGIDPDEFLTHVCRWNTDFLMAAVSQLSDSQEMIERGDVEEARKTINRAKLLIGEIREKLGRDQAYDLSKRSK